MAALRARERCESLCHMLMHSGAAFPLHLAPLDPNFLLLLFLPQQVEAGLGAALQKGYDAVGAPCVTGLLSLRVA